MCVGHFPYGKLNAMISGALDYTFGDEEDLIPRSWRLGVQGKPEYRVSSKNKQSQCWL